MFSRKRLILSILITVAVVAGISCACWSRYSSQIRISAQDWQGIALRQSEMIAHISEQAIELEHKVLIQQMQIDSLERLLETYKTY